MVPWIRRVPATTTNAASWSVSRSGVSTGSRNTAARVTTPRIPAHPTTAPVDHPHACLRIRRVPCLYAQTAAMT